MKFGGYMESETNPGASSILPYRTDLDRPVDGREHMTHRWMNGVLLAVTGGLAAATAAGQDAELSAAGRTASGAGTAAVAAEKKPLDHSVYDEWNYLRGHEISPDGRWALYRVVPGDGDATVVVTSTSGEIVGEFERGGRAEFSDDSAYAAVLVRPDEETVKRQREEGVAEAARDKASLHLLDLESGEVAVVDRVKSFKLPDEGGGVIAYQLFEPAEDGSGESSTESAAAARDLDQPAGGGDGSGEDEKEKQNLGTDLVLRRLDGGAEMVYSYVTEYEFCEDGSKLAFAARTPDDAEDGVYLVDTLLGIDAQLASGAGRYKAIAFSEAGDRLVFLTDRDADMDAEEDRRAFSVYLWSEGDRRASALAEADDRGVPEGWWVADNPSPRFSESGNRVIFGTQPRPEPVEKDEDGVDEAEDDEPEVRVDIWHWQDADLQPRQKLLGARERDRSYTAVSLLDEGGRIVQLANEDRPSVQIGSDGDADYAVANTDEPYAIERSWDTPGYVDVYLIDVRTGYATKVLERHHGYGARLSPNARYLTWSEGGSEEILTLSVEGALNGAEPRSLTAKIPHPVFDELHDTPSLPRPYGFAGWTDGDETALIYDRYDVWAVDPTGFWAPSCMTDGTGRALGVRLRRVPLDPDADTIDPAEEMLLSAFNETTKAEGFYLDSVRGTEAPERVIMLDESLGGLEKAEDADRALVIRETFERSPDLWSTTMAMREFERLSDINPQQDEYLWGTAELHEWISLDGEPLQGILYKPEDFDPDKRYPMMVYFYERLSDRLHSYEEPAPARASINTSFYVSRGYVVFKPDIPYRVGFPGRSAESAVIPGVTSVLELGFVDPDRVGVQGHSWGGYQSLHLVTVTDLFAACESGAPVSNMTSAYGGIRWGSGLVRQFQYERTQSRIGASLWEKPTHYIENSPLFRATEIDTPLLILHNDEDGAVPWYQGIEMFNAMRRLGKPAWMFNYNNEAHGLRQRHNQKDWAVRMQQFFDHYLKDALPPEWLVEGVPAVEKGENLGLELVEDPGR